MRLRNTGSGVVWVFSFRYALFLAAIGGAVIVRGKEQSLAATVRVLIGTFSQRQQDR